MLTRYKGPFNIQHRLNEYIGDCKEDDSDKQLCMLMCVRCSVLRLCSQHRTFQLELGEFAPGLEPLEFVSGECSSSIKLML